jgi:outer membrane protein assembly factor BamA
MSQARSLHLTVLFAVAIFLLLTAVAFAEDSGSDTLTQEQVTENLAQEEAPPQSVVVSEDTAVIGIVDRIELKGQVVTSQASVLRQMTFRVGDRISKRDLDLTRKRLLSFNGIYWQANITWADSDQTGHVIVTVDLRAGRSWYISPSIPAGGAISTRNFLGTGKTVAVGVFIGEDNADFFYNVTYVDPQFLGGHNSLVVEGHILDTSGSIRTDDLYSTGESYLLDRNGFSLTYNTRWRETIGVSAGYRWDQVDAEKSADPFGSLGTEDKFYFSGREIPDGNVGLVTFRMSSGTINSRFFPTKGYYWDFYNELANSLTGSDFDLSRHTVTFATFQDIYEGRNVVCGRFLYSYLTGDPPDYELLPFDWQVRGYTGGTHRGKSLLAMNFEYRFIAEPDIFQGVLFADLGRSWDDHNFSLNDLEFGYGMGLRIYTSYFIPYNLLLRLDYGFSDDGEELIFGFNQFF